MANQILLEKDEPYVYRTQAEADRISKKLNKKPSKRDQIRSQIVEIVLKQHFEKYNASDITTWLNETFNTVFDYTEVNKAIKEFPQHEVKQIVVEAIKRKDQKFMEFRINELSEIIMQASNMRKKISSNDVASLSKLTDTMLKATAELEKLNEQNKETAIHNLQNKDSEDVISKIEELEAAKRKAMERREAKDAEERDKFLCESNGIGED